MKKFLLALVVIVVLGALYYFVGGGKDYVESQNVPDEAPGSPVVSEEFGLMTAPEL